MRAKAEAVRQTRRELGLAMSQFHSGLKLALLATVRQQETQCIFCTIATWFASQMKEGIPSLLLVWPQQHAAKLASVSVSFVALFSLSVY